MGDERMAALAHLGLERRAKLKLLAAVTVPAGDTPPRRIRRLPDGGRGDRFAGGVCTSVAVRVPDLRR